MFHIWQTTKTYSSQTFSVTADVVAPAVVIYILYLHNTIKHHFYPPKHLHRHCFRFPLGHLHVPGELANNDCAKFWGVKEVY